MERSDTNGFSGIGNNTSKIVLNQFEPIYFNVYEHKRLKVVNFGMSNANGNGNGTERFQIEIL